MASDSKPDPAAKRTQKTRPKKGKPVEIPVPKRSAFEKVLKRAEKSKKT